MALTVDTFTMIIQRLVTYLQANTALITDYNEGSVVQTLLEAMAMEFDKNYYQLELVQTAGYIQQAVDGDLDLKANDFNLTRIQATNAQGFVTLSCTAPAPAAGVPIPANSVWSTPPQFTAYDSLAFTNRVAAQIDPGQTSVTIPCVAVIAGTSGNVLAGQIAVNTSDVPGIDLITNASPFTGGANEEIDTTLRARVSTVLKGINAGTEDNYKTIILNNTTAIVTSVAIVGPNEPLMTRDSGVGGKVDIYFEGDANPTQFTETFVFTNPNPYVISPNPYNPPDFPLQRNQPVDQIVSVVDLTTGLTVPSGDYTFIPDTSVFARSDRAQDMVVFQSLPALNGHTFQVTFFADKTVGDLRTLIEPWRPITADVMIKEGIQLLIDANVQPFYAPGVDLGSAREAMLTVLTAYVDGLPLGGTLYVTEALRQMAEATVNGLKVVSGFNTLTAIFPQNIPGTLASITAAKNQYFSLVLINWI